MKVLFLMFKFPDMDTSFNMYTSIVEEFHNNGHEVYVIAPSKGTPTELKKEMNIPVLRVKTLPLANVNPIKKGIANVLLPHQYERAFKKHFKDISFDAVILPTPPITLSGFAAKLKKRFNAAIYLILRDIFPQNAVDLEMMKKGSLVHRMFRRQEERLYKIADFIGCMSQGNINFVKKFNPELPDNKFHILENFQRINNDLERNYEVLEKYDLQGKYIVMFGGNMGKPQQLENVVELAKRCEEQEDVVFLLLGEGHQKKKLEEMIKEKECNNIVLRSTIPKQDYQEILKVCNVGLISLNAKFTIPNIPSKNLDYYNVGIPVLASIDRATDYDKFLEESGGGLWSYAGDIDAFKKNFDKLYNSKELRLEMAKKGREYFVKYLTPDKAYLTVSSKLEEKINTGNK